VVNWLLKAGLIVLPFILAPGGGDVAREPKMAWALVFSLAISLVMLYQGKLKAFKNKWAFLLVGLCLISFYASPKPELPLFGIESGRFWSWEPLYQGLVFLLFTISVASIEFDKKTLSDTLDVMIWCGGIIGVYVILQFFRLDQFFEHRYCTYGHMHGMFGNSRLVGPFLGMIVPLALFRKKYLLAVPIVISVVLTRSNIALFGLILMFAAYFALRDRKSFIAVTSAVIAGAAVFGALYITQPVLREKVPDHCRFLTWRQSVNDLREPVMKDSKKTYAMTGIGPGSFKYLFHAKHNVHNDNMLYAHNEYVQVLYETGIFGLFLFLATIFALFQRVIPQVFKRELSHLDRALTSSVVCVLTCAGGIFILQMGAHIFYTLTVIGLLYNRGVKDAC